MMFLQRRLAAVAFLRRPRPHGQMFQHKLCVRFGATEFWFAPGASLENLFQDVPHKRTNAFHSAFLVRSRVAHSSLMRTLTSRRLKRIGSGFQPAQWSSAPLQIDSGWKPLGRQEVCPTCWHRVLFLAGIGAKILEGREQLGVRGGEIRIDGAGNGYEFAVIGRFHHVPISAFLVSLSNIPMMI